MRKQDFLARLREGLSGLPREDREEQLAFYQEIIEDRMEEGLSEEEAVDGLGSVEVVVSQIISEVPLKKLVKERFSQKTTVNVWMVVLLVLGFPLWFPLLIAAAAVVFSLYVSLWAVIISLWAVFGSVAACAAAFLLVGLCIAVIGPLPAGLGLIGGSLICGGLSLFLFVGCKVVTDGTLRLTKHFVLWLKNRIVRKEAV